MPQASYPLSQATGLVGQAHTQLVVDRGTNGVASARVWTLTVGSATDDTTYTLWISVEQDDGGTVWGSVSYTSDGTATTAEIGDGLSDAWDASAFATGVAYTGGSGASITFTSLAVNSDFTVLPSSGDLSLASTGGGTPAVIPYGRLVVPSGTAGAVLEANTTNLSALAYTITPTDNSGTIYDIAVTYGGVTYPTQFTSAGGGAGALVTAFTTAINGLMPANSVIASGTTTLILTAEVVGANFSVAAGVSDATGALAVSSNDEATLDDQAGFAMLLGSNPGVYDASGYSSYAAWDEVALLRSGSIQVGADTTISGPGQLYYHTSGNDIGKWTQTASATAAPVNMGRFRIAETISATEVIIFAMGA